MGGCQRLGLPQERRLAKKATAFLEWAGVSPEVGIATGPGMGLGLTSSGTQTAPAVQSYIL